MQTSYRKSSIFPLFLFLLFYAVLPAQASPNRSLVEPIQLKKWIDNGYHTEKGERVVIIEVIPNRGDKETWFAGDTEKLKQLTIRKYGEKSPQHELILELDRKGALGHIPGALYLTSHSAGEVADRSDGPIETEHEVGTGAQIEAMLQRLGVTSSDVLVITSSQQNPWMVCSARLWWTLYYWGFPPEKLKLLDGMDKGYAFTGYPLEKGTHTPAVTPSKIELAQLSPRHLDTRVGLGEMLSLVDNGKTSRGEVFLLDTRQPPAAYYLSDGRKEDGASGSDGVPDIMQLKDFSYNPQGGLFTRHSDKAAFNLSQMLFSAASNDGKSPRASFNMTTNPPVQLPNPFLGMHRTKTVDGLAIPIGVKSAAFEGIIKGAHLTKTATYNITVPALVGPDNRYKNREELLSLFAKAGIDGTKPVILYCNTGALSSFYFYALQEICGFKNVRMYDGSWTEWSNLTAFEPVDTTYVRKDNQLVYPAYLSMTPALLFFDGRNNYLEWSGNGFIDAVTGTHALPSQVRLGGSLKGDLRWDTLHRSEHVVFRPSATVNNSKKHQTYNSDTDWPEVETSPEYSGEDKIIVEDGSYGKKSAKTL